MSNITVIMPEIFLLSMTCIVLLLDIIFKSRQKKLVYYFSQLSLLSSLGMIIYLSYTGNIPISGIVIFDHGFILDRLAVILKAAILLSSMFVFWVSHDYIKSRKIAFAEFYILSLLAVLGMLLLVSSDNFIVLFLSLELSALPVYALVALWQDSSYGSEAAMKYFVMGTLASGMLLYGLSMLYGASGSLDIGVMHSFSSTTTSSSSDLLLVFGLVFILAGIAFKFGAAPFHLWVPDIYTGAPTAVTLFIGAAPKIAALGMMFRLLVDTLPVLQPQWQQILIVVSIASMGLGNFAAIMQTNLKRMLAYSSISHIGYLLLGFIAGTQEGYSAALFYILSYSIMALGAFGLLVILSRQREIEEIKDLKGLNSRNPWLAFMFLLILFSMAGIPPTVGFFAKLGVLHALMSVHLVWLAVLALVFAIIGAYYYINVIKTMYFESPDELSQAPFSYPFSLNIAMTLSGLSVLGLGMLPGLLMHLTRSIF